MAKKGEGTFSEVLKAQNVKDGKYHAIKCMKNRFDSIDQVTNYLIFIYERLVKLLRNIHQVNNLREIQALSYHPMNILYRWKKYYFMINQRVDLLLFLSSWMLTYTS